MGKTARKPEARNTRAYRSPLREQHASQTKDRILDALVRVMARDGIADISIPMVAKEAGVSIPSVYRHFPTKRLLIEALDEYAHRKGSFPPDEFGTAASPEELAKIIPRIFERRTAIEPMLSAAMNSHLGYAIRRPEFKERAKFIADALRPVAGHMNAKERAWFVDIVFVMNSFATVRAFKDYLELDTREAAKRVAWAIRTLAAGAEKTQKKRK